jgi:hypothetical protein
LAKVSSQFVCNPNALSPSERPRHQWLTTELVSKRKRITETERGYEFQYQPAEVSLAELAEWVGRESRCCPFFDFQIALEDEGTMLCLRLAGGVGVKPFIRGEFHVGT